MKKIVILVFMLFLLIDVGNSQYYDNNYGEYDDQYYNTDYDDYYYTDYDDNYLTYYYGYDDALPYIRMHSGPIYYWLHPYRDIYFVLIGSRIFIMPGYRLRPILYRLGWLGVAMDRFITLSCCGLHYYDNYMRFNYYYDYYRRYNYSRYHNHWVRNHYRDYYRNRRRSKHYFRDYNRVMGKRRVINKRSLSPRKSYRYDNNRYRNQTSTKRRSVMSTRSYNKYNNRKSNNYNRYDRYKDTVKKRTVYRKQGTPRSAGNYTRKISKVSRTGYRKPTSKYSREVSKISTPRYSKQPSRSSRSSYSKHKIRKVNSSKSSRKSSNKSRKVSRKRR